MSWTKRPQGGAVPPPGPERQPYIAAQAQPFGNQENMYPNYQGGAAGNIQQQQQQQFWQMPPQQQQQAPYNQQYGQVYQQQDYPPNANQFYPQSNTYNNMNYPNQGFNNTPQVRYPQQNYYQNQGHESQVQQQNFSQTKPNADSWEDNWDWGWGEDSAKQAQKASQNPAQLPPPHHPQQQVFNNANVIEESFATSDSNCWNWAMDDKKDPKEPAAVPANHEPPATLPVSNPVVENNSVPEPAAPRSASNMSAQQAEEVRTLNDREVVKERLPNLALGKRFHLDNLTPQWSIESQMSQESSDGLHTQSEGTYRSENQSRNSSKSSPGLNTDNSNFNYSQPGIDEGFVQNSEWSRPSDEPTLADSTQSNSRRESHDELSTSMQEMSLINHEIPSTDSHIVHEGAPRYVQDTVPSAQPPPAASPASFPPPMSSNILPPPAAVMQPPPSSTPSSVNVSAPPLSSAVPPPNFPPPTSSSNPFKHAGPFSHKSLPKGSASATSVQSFPPMASTNLTSPAAVSKVSQHNRLPVGFEANLETTPDNSERPDHPQVSAFRPMPVSHPVPDNLEVAPRSDRNEYLQTAHLSSGDFGENTDFSRGVPPGLRRMVVGQQESEYSQNLNISGDEPPPGLARMVPGQQTEIDNGYNQPSDNYLDRHVDGQTTDNSTRPYRQADGQQTPDNYTQQTPSRVTERRPIGLDRMVPGEPSNDEYPQFQGSNYAAANEHRVVTGVDHGFSIPADAGPPDVREQNVDGSDYTEQSSNPPRNVIGAREPGNAASPDFAAPPDEHQREVTMEGENLQDLSIISSTELTFSREQVLDGADVTHSDVGNDRKTDLSDSIDHQASSSRRQSLNRVNTSGEDSERDRAFKSSPRRDREKHKSSRDRDRDNERDRDRDRDKGRDRDKDGRYSRGDRKYDPERRSTRDEWRSEKDRRDRERRERDESPDARRHRRSTRSQRYEPDDPDYYSDRERDRRRHREGSYTSSKPPRPDDKDRRYDERDRTKRYNTIERDRRYDDERQSRRRGERYSERYAERDRYERAYRDIDPTRKYGNLRRQRDKDEQRRGEYSPSRAQSRGEATATDDDAPDARRRERRARRTAEPFYDEYGGAGAYADPYLAQRQQYQYYEQLRLSNPAAYMALYKQIMAGHAPPAPAQPAPLYSDDFVSLMYDSRQERGSVHSGRSSATGLKGNDTDLNTDMSLNLHLEESTVRSERMTPFKFSTAHIKGSISSRDVVVVRPSYPVDGAPATVHVLSLAAALQQLPQAQELAAFVGPLVKGVTHKKSVIDYCMLRVRSAAHEGARDEAGYALVWELLALMLRQNGVVVGSDIAELLMKNTRDYEYKTTTNKTHNESRRGSSLSSEARERDDERSTSPEQPSLSVSENIKPESLSSPGESALEERAALDKLRELLTYGNRQEAIECAISNNLWGHALSLAAFSDRRTRAGVSARFVAALRRADPLHTLYGVLAATTPPAATCVSDERWGDWRPHAAIILSNPSAKPEQDRRTLTQLGDSLNSRGLLYCAQFCYLSAGVQLSRHPLAPLAPPAAAGAPPAAPPRLALLLADPRAATLQQFATNTALFATEVYEYALSLSQDEYVITELQAYKLVLACRLADCGLYERALAYTEAAARAVTRSPRDYSRALVLRLAELAERLKYHDPSLHVSGALADEADSAEASPRHAQQWLDDVRSVAHALSAESATQESPQHEYYAQQQYAWEHAQAQQQYQQVQQPVPTYAEPVEDKTDYSTQYYAQPAQPSQPSPERVAQPPPPAQLAQPQPAQPQPDEPQYAQYDDWPRPDEQHQQYADPYWHTDQSYGGYGEMGAGGEAARPSITMPGASAPRDYDDDRPPSADDDRDTDTPKTSAKKQEGKSKDEGSKGDSRNNKGGGWLGGILNKLSLRAPNQMILPDDKNPSIVWDAGSKRWRNVDGDSDERELPPPPPPKTQDLAHVMQSASPPLPAVGAPPSATPAAPVSNIFKMQKGRHIKKSYVDVFNPSGAPTRALPPAEEVLGPAPPAAAPTNYFVPAPLHQNSIYDPSRLDNSEDMYRSGI